MRPSYLLGNYIVPVQYQTITLTAIQIDSIIGKAVIMDADT